MLNKIAAVVFGLIASFGFVIIAHDMYGIYKVSMAYDQTIRERKVAHHTAGTCVMFTVKKGNEFEEPQYLYGQIDKVGHESYLIQYFSCNKFDGLYKSFKTVDLFYYVDELNSVINCERATQRVCEGVK